MEPVGEGRSGENSRDGERGDERGEPDVEPALRDVAQKPGGAVDGDDEQRGPDRLLHRQTSEEHQGRHDQEAAPHPEKAGQETDPQPRKDGPGKARTMAARMGVGVLRISRTAETVSMRPAKISSRTGGETIRVSFRAQ